MEVNALRLRDESLLHRNNEIDEKGKQSALPETQNKSPGGDSFQKSDHSVQFADESTTIEADRLTVAFHFDLFYQLSQTVEAKMGRQGATRFTEVSAKVSETFQASFSLQIDGVGAFLKGTDASLKISPDVTNAFFDSVEGLADLSPESLERFLKESDTFFSALEEEFGPLENVLEDIKTHMKDQALAFFSQVGNIRDEPSQGALIPMAGMNGLFFSQKEYQDFLQSFLTYADRFRKNMLKDFFQAKPIDEKKEESREFQVVA